jgi:predicted permease
MYNLSEPYFRILERNGFGGVFSDVFATFGGIFQVRGSSGNEEFRGAWVSGEFFAAMQTSPLLGRYLTPQDDQPGGNPSGLAVVISESFWQIWFNRAPDVVGRKLVVANHVFTVIGVMPKRFIGTDIVQRPQLYLPLAAEAILNAPDSMTSAGYHAFWMHVFARRQSGITLEQADAALSAATGSIIAQVTDPESAADARQRKFRFTAEPGSRGFTPIRRLFTKPLEAVFAMCGGILLLACLNLASLLMARSAARERELATRLAMGATRRRLVQQLLIESLMIAVLGTVAGLAAAPALSRTLAAMLIGTKGGNAQLDTALDARVFLFAAGIAVVTSLLIGLAPALRATSSNLSEHIKDGQHASKFSPRRFSVLPSLPQALMAIEIGLAVILVAGAGLLATSLTRLYKTGLGFDPHGVVNLALNMDKQDLEGDALTQLYRQIGEDLSRQPGVASASYAMIVPLMNSVWDWDLSVAGGKSHDIDMNGIAPNYFQTMRIPLLTGRDFTWNDTAASGLKVILNHSAAQLLFPGVDPIGRQVTVNGGDKKLMTVVGIVGDAHYEDVRSAPPPAGYVPFTQRDRPFKSYNLVVRLEDGASAVAFADSARKIVARLAPEIPAPVMTAMSSVVDDSIAAERMMAVLSIYFGVCALLVTAIGLYGTLAYATARRTSEIGIRMALGAKRSQVAALVFRQNASVAVVGSAMGLIAALLASRAIESFLYGISARDPWVLACSVFALAAIASAASLLPALRAARIEPMAAIRCE